MPSIVQQRMGEAKERMFQYLDDEGNRHTIGSAEVNDYLREISGEEITAKDFRTWAGTFLAAMALRELGAIASGTQRRSTLVRAVEQVAAHLSNTVAVCRKCYIHPAIFDGYLDGTLLDALKQRTEEKLADPGHGLKAEEAAVVAFLAHQLAEQPTDGKTIKLGSSKPQAG